MLVFILAIQEGMAPTKAQRRQPAEYVPFMYSAGNSWYKSYIADEVDCPGPAPFSLLTGPSHPWGNEQMITSYYVPGWDWPWWSYGTFRDYSLSYEYVLGYTGCCETDWWGNCTQWSPLAHVQATPGWTRRSGYSYYTSAGASGSATYTTWQFENFWVEQRIEAQGTSYDDSRIMVRYRIRNTSSTTRCYGLRLLLDINVATYDGAYFWDPVNDWRADEEAWDSPVPFDYWIISEASNWTGAYYIHGNIRRTDWGMTPTEPEHFSYAYWGDWSEPFGGGLFAEAWQDCAYQDRVVGGVDAAVAYWWGWTPSSRCLAPGEEDTISQFFFSSPEPVFEVGEEGRGPVRLLSTVVSASRPELRFSGSWGIPFALYDIAGRIIVQGKTNARVALPSLKKGLYYVTIGKRRYKIVAQ